MSTSILYFPIHEAGLDTHTGVPRISAHSPEQASAGKVQWAPLKSLWWFFMVSMVLMLGWQTLSWASLGVFMLTTGITLCLGHSLGMHRRLIHNSYQCPLWLEYFFVWLGTLVGMAGPLSLMRTHDTRDWAQRQPRCHDYFAHRQSFWRDGWWQIHCEVKLNEPPQFQAEPRVANSRFYRWLEATWMAQQLIPAALLYALGGWAYVVWGVCARVAVCVTGHWLIGHFAHRQGGQYWHVGDAGVQGYNVHLKGVLKPLTAWLTMGECWHNNHHAYPGSARLGLQSDELDLGWWVLRALAACKLVTHIKQPHDLPIRPSLQTLSQASPLNANKGTPS
jgi:sn-1 stearoyl-lipid 9-desaturase